VSRAFELLTSLRESVDALRAALGAAASAWERAPAEGEWSPRLVAEHIIVAFGVYSEFLAAAIGREPFDWTARTYAFPTPGDARERLDELYAWVEEAMASLDDVHLGLPVPELGAQARQPTLEGLLMLMARHLGEHARQIEGGRAALR